MLYLNYRLKQPKKTKNQNQNTSDESRGKQSLDFARDKEKQDNY